MSPEADEQAGAAGFSTSTTLQQLQTLTAQIGDAVEQQQRALLHGPAEQRIQAAVQTSGQLSRLLLFWQRSLEDLAQQIVAQEQERDRLSALQDVAATINSSLELDPVLNQVMDVIISLTDAERAMLLLLDEDNGQLEVQVARNMDRETIEQAESFQISRSIVRQVADSGEPVVTMNAQEDDRFAAQESIISYRLRSILCVPLKIKDDIIGVIYADNRINSGIFGETDRDLLAAFANQAAVAIENARLFRAIRANLAEITEMKDLMDSVFASIASGVITIDEADRIGMVNRAAEGILGVPAQAILAQPLTAVWQELGLPAADLIQKVKGNGSTLSLEVDVERAPRTSKTTLNLTVSPLRDMQKESLGVAMVLDDVSEKKRLESVRRYLPPTLVDRVRDLDAAQLPQQRTLSVIFADLRGFSGFSEELEPQLLVEVLNGYFTLAVQAITHYEGFTDKFMGDAVMALFNTPLNPQEDHVVRSLRTALMLRESMAAYRASLPVQHRLHFGIGVHSGKAVVGNVGSDLRKDYSAVGDAVNLAKRLQEVAQPNQILISRDVYERARDWLVVEELPPLQLKGRQAQEQIYDLRGFKG